MKYFHKVKRFFKNHNAVIILSIIFIFFPIIIWMIYMKLKQSCFLLKISDVLSYYAAVFGIFGSFLSYYIDKEHRKKERQSKIKPKFVVDLEKTNEKIFKLTICNCLEPYIKNIFFI